MRLPSARHLRTSRTAAWFIGAILIALWFIHGLPADANQVTAQATDVQMVRDGDVVTITAKVRVRNEAAAPVTGLTVVGSEGGLLRGQTLHIGVVLPQEEVVSDSAYTFTMDLSQTPLRHIGVPVTIQFMYNGEPMEVSWGLSHAFPTAQ